MTHCTGEVVDNELFAEPVTPAAAAAAQQDAPGLCSYQYSSYQ